MGDFEARSAFEACGQSRRHGEFLMVGGVVFSQDLRSTLSSCMYQSCVGLHREEAPERCGSVTAWATRVQLGVLFGECWAPLLTGLPALREDTTRRFTSHAVCVTSVQLNGYTPCPRNGHCHQFPGHGPNSTLYQLVSAWWWLSMDMEWAHSFSTQGFWRSGATHVG